MNMKRVLFPAVILVLLTALPLHAQNGCVDSPEDPTVLLALVSGAGVLAASLWRFRRKRP